MLEVKITELGLVLLACMDGSVCVHIAKLFSKWLY